MKALIYGRPGCAFCDKAKTLCSIKGIDYDYKVVGTDIQKEQLEEMVGHSISSIPQIFLVSEGFSEYVGGFNDLKAKLDAPVNESTATDGGVLNG